MKDQTTERPKKRDDRPEFWDGIACQIKECKGRRMDLCRASGSLNSTTRLIPSRERSNFLLKSFWLAPEECPRTRTRGSKVEGQEFSAWRKMMMSFDALTLD